MKGNTAREDNRELVDHAIHHLPGRCREVLILRKVHGLSLSQIARRLGRAESTVEAQAAAAVRRCMECLRESHGGRPESARALPVDDDAAGWLIAAESGLTAEEQQELDAWLRESHRHRTAWAEAQVAWQCLDRCAELPRETLMSDCDLHPLPPASEADHTVLHGHAGWWISAAAAAVLLITAGLVLRA